MVPNAVGSDPWFFWNSLKRKIFSGKAFIFFENERQFAPTHGAAVGLKDTTGVRLYTENIPAGQDTGSAVTCCDSAQMYSNDNDRDQPAAGKGNREPVLSAASL